MSIRVNNPEPIVVLFGPTACGKTSLSLSLMCYLHRIGYTFNTDYGLGPNYVDWWENYMAKALENRICNPPQVHPIPLLSRIFQNNVAKFQILDIPGEECKCPLPAYINRLIHLPNKKIMVFVLDFTSDERDRGYHLNLFSDIYNTALAFSYGKTDLNALFVVNKVDCMNIYIKQNYKEFINFKLDNILLKSPFLSEKKLLGFLPIRRKNYSVIPYSSYRCNLFHDLTGRVIPIYIEDKYPKQLWNTIQSALSGRF